MHFIDISSFYEYLCYLSFVSFLTTHLCYVQFIAKIFADFVASALQSQGSMYTNPLLF